MTKKTIDSASKIFSHVFEHIPKEKRTGFSSKILPFKIKNGASLALAGGAFLLSSSNEMAKSFHRGPMGEISYADGPMRLTTSDTSGVVESLERLSQGDEKIFQELGSHVMDSNLTNKLEDYGATGDLVFALHNRR